MSSLNKEMGSGKLHTKDELVQQLNDFTNDFLSHDVNSYANNAPISYRDNEPNTSLHRPTNSIHKFVRI